MEHHIVTIATGDFFDQGLGLLNTWRISGADKLYVYGLGFTTEQIEKFKRFGAIYVNVTDVYKYFNFEEAIMYYKMAMIRNHLKQFKAITSYIDYDTMISQSWNHIYEEDFDVGLTVRENPRAKNTLQSAILDTNGGVIFSKPSDNGIRFFNWSIETILHHAQMIIRRRGHKAEGLTKIAFTEIRENGLLSKNRVIPIVSGPLLDNYSTIGKANKVNLAKIRWWCDQLFCSCVINKIYEKYKERIPVLDHRIEKIFNFKIGMFNCPIYNDTSEFSLENINDSEYMKTRYIIHFKGSRKKRVYNYMLEDLKKL